MSRESGWIKQIGQMARKLSTDGREQGPCGTCELVSTCKVARDVDRPCALEGEKR